MKQLRVFLILLSLVCGIGCQSVKQAPLTSAVVEAEAKETAVSPPPPTPTLAPTRTPPSTPTPTPIPSPTATPIFSGTRSPACGQLLPILPSQPPNVTTALTPDPTLVAELTAQLPEAARPALTYLLENPQHVGLAYYRMGQESSGAYLNADVPMPLASVAKLIILAAYVEAVAAGQLNPLEPVGVETLARYYLPGSDLGTHERALAELAENGRLSPTTNTIPLNDVAWMMIRHSSNAASDYLHLRLGQTTIEETALWLGLTQQTAPCPFLAQFLTMNNHTRDSNSASIIQGYINQPASYGEEAMLLADAFSQNDAFRAAEIGWRSERRGAFGASRLFSESLNPQGTAREYGALMARFAQNGLSSGESSYQARLILEWPMQFANNQAVFDNLGYKNGSLPGILTVAYYAYPAGETSPMVMVLFFRDLPADLYRGWRSNTLAHDELARWLLANPQAVPLLRRLFP